mmetsp:Transcript_1780/g.4004  ORF Transcript_1780/g.4004 Transcript_1780/m.4004 type:complete len:154 (+) Transcript_1780:106-567(+)|eukprot:CAMPEP_0206584740 /NCGR_PEP_ID=MMETSP0325_2-20121206/35938_1 /ASSEMBLY_ACC=CAM_ASM_000347 /TAXON_ID=2866 /ORGANISM="Crypthecodinium cohnii, Strain Seligo" /LENGTH=153 /DNA_ID=CAMNT_0054092027 /DNA_START=34 /DNA_END=495 /DNA_ORIENTATION=-
MFVETALLFGAFGSCLQGFCTGIQPEMLYNTLSFSGKASLMASQVAQTALLPHLSCLHFFVGTIQALAAITFRSKEQAVILLASLIYMTSGLWHHWQIYKAEGMKVPNWLASDEEFYTPIRIMIVCSVVNLLGLIAASVRACQEMLAAKEKQA